MTKHPQTQPFKWIKSRLILQGNRHFPNINNMPTIFPLCQSNVLFTYLQTVLLLAKWIWSAIFLNNSWLISMYHLTSLYFDLLFVNLLSCKMLIRWVPSTTFLKIINHMFISWFNGFHQFKLVWYCLKYMYSENLKA